MYSFAIFHFVLEFGTTARDLRPLVFFLVNIDLRSTRGQTRCTFFQILFQIRGDIRKRTWISRRVSDSSDTESGTMTQITRRRCLRHRCCRIGGVSDIDVTNKTTLIQSTNFKALHVTFKGPNFKDIVYYEHINSQTIERKKIFNVLEYNIE